MSEKKLDAITIQDIADQANVNRATVYLHYLDKFDLLDKIIEEHITNMGAHCEENPGISWIDSTEQCMAYLEDNFLFFYTMLANEGAPYFRNQFVKHNIEEFRKEIDLTNGKNVGLSEDVVLEFVANAYVAVIEWWIKNKMPCSPREMAKKVGVLLERNL